MSSLQNILHTSFVQHENRDAISVKGKTYRYKDVYNYLCALDQALPSCSDHIIAIMGDRSLSSYIGVAYSMFSGKTFVPINPSFPDKQNQTIIKLSGATVLVFDASSWKAIKAILDRSESPLLLCVLDDENICETKNSEIKEYVETSPHSLCFVTSNNRSHDLDLKAPEDSWLYVLFTSGTTGTPKGVPISHRNVAHYINGLCDMLSLSPDDRFTQLFDLTFDLSMHDIFLAWAVGGCLCIPASIELIAPKKYLQREKITVWFSVPSVAAIMKKMKLLEADSYPDIRYSLFCGEALPAVLAETWQQASPNSKVINLYGPTEATIAFTSYEFKASADVDYMNGIIPIGKPFGENKAMIFNDKAERVSFGDQGELCLSGAQLTQGYLNNEAQNRACFFIEKDTGIRWYKTGDIACYDESVGYIYMGRTDHQTKILGYRVELAEVEHVLRRVSERDHVAAIPWPIHDGCAQGIVAFIVDPDITADEIKKQCKLELVQYKRPSQIYIIDEMPLNANGKIDRNQLKAYLTERM